MRRTTHPLFAPFAWLISLVTRAMDGLRREPPLEPPPLLYPWVLEQELSLVFERDVPVEPESGEIDLAALPPGKDDDDEGGGDEVGAWVPLRGAGGRHTYRSQISSR